MKTYVILFLCLSSLAFSQNKVKMSDVNDNNIELKMLPEIVLTKIGDDFSVYLPENHPDYSVNQMQEFFIAYDLGKDYEGYDSYLVIMQNDKGTLTAKYNQKGKLINVLEKYENVRLPNEVVYTITTAFPGWGIVDDKYVYEQSDGDIKRNEYKVKIKKDSKSKKIVINSDGEIIKG
jgi:hypothetical protein